MSAMGPRLIVSIDFELRWGLHDRLGSDLQAYRGPLEGVREAVPILLQTLRETSIKATWACVGALGCTSWSDYFAWAPPPPRYADPTLTFDPRWCDWDPHGTLHFAPQLLEAIRDTPGQEIASHTFGHLYLGEPGVMRADVERDCQAIRSLFRERLGVVPMSLVFPRNQPFPLSALAPHGIRVVRTNPPQWYWNQTRGDQQTWWTRAPRLLDGFVARTPRTPETHGAGVISTAASFFVRWNLPEPLWSLHLNAIVESARRAPSGSVLHLWFHPHNLGVELARSTRRLRTLFGRLTNPDLGMHSVSMGMLADPMVAEIAA